MKDNKIKSDKKNKSRSSDFKEKKKNFGTKEFLSKCKHSRFNVEESDNDFVWYNQSPQLVKDVANLAYSEFLGSPVNLGANDTVSDAFPGICKIRLFPTLGNCGTKGDAPNVAAQTLYAYVRSYNSGSRNYYASDYFMYIYSIASLYGVYAELVRTYGLCRKYSLQNKYLGAFIVRALGYNFDNLVQNLADFRALINNFALQLNSFAIPSQFNYIDRLTWIPLHVYKDADIDKSQLYAMQYTHTYKWNPTAVKSGSALEPIRVPWTEYDSATITSIRSFIDTLLSQVRLNEDVAIMSGDTYKAFGANGIRSVAMIPEDVVTEPIYNEGVLCQIHNARVCGSVNAMSESTIADNFDLDPDAGLEPSDMLGLGWIYQDNEVILCEPFIPYGNITASFNSDMTQMNNMKILLDCPYSEPTPEFNMEATRLIAHPYGRSLTLQRIGSLSPLQMYEVGCTGTEIVTNVELFYYNHDNNEIDYDYMKFMMTTDDVDDVSYLARLSKFDWAPQQYIGYWNGTEKVYHTLTTIGDVFNYTTVPLNTIKSIHDVAILSLFNLVNLLQSTRVGK